MKVNNIKFYEKNNNKFNLKSNVSFKKGLPSEFLRYSKEVNPYQIEREMRYKGIEASFNGVAAVAASCEKVVEIMEHYGFHLPRFFSFEPCGSLLGLYNSRDDKVVINSNQRAFYNIKDQNRLEESQGSYHPKTKHFLHTYLHEFSHAAHYKNLCEKLGNSEGNRVYWGYLTNNSPRDIIISPLKTLAKSLCESRMLNFIIDKAIPSANGEYGKAELCEYIAERNARLIAEDLGEDLDLVYNSELPFEESPNNWIENTKFMQSPNLYDLIDLIIKSRKYFDHDIWNGDVDKLSSAKNMFYIR